MFHENELSPMIRSSDTIFYSLLYLNLRLSFGRLKYLYTVISVSVDLLPANTKTMAIDMFVDVHIVNSRILGGLLSHNVTTLLHI